MLRIVAVALIILPVTGLARSPDWSMYDELLGEYVHEGVKHGLPVNLVDYPGLKGDARFSELVETIRTWPVEELEGERERLAFYINAYNILTIELIHDHWPVDSIKDIGGFFKGPWDMVVLENADGSLTLDDIEHDIIRSFGEPKIHFAVNCASVSCPNLRGDAYRADNLYKQLQDQTTTFLRQEGKGIRVAGETVRVSKILDWYEEDFEKAGGIKAFVRQYRPDLDIARLKANLNYDWSLNYKLTR